MNKLPIYVRGDRVRKITGSKWQGIVVGEYSTALTPEGYAVESESETGSVQIYPVKALELVDKYSVVPQRSNGKEYVDCRINKATSFVVRQQLTDGGTNDLRRFSIATQAQGFIDVIRYDQRNK